MFSCVLRAKVVAAALLVAGGAFAADGAAGDRTAAGAVSIPDTSAFAIEPDQVVDEAALLRRRFIPLESADNLGSKERDLIAEKFVADIGKTVGRKPPLEFSFTLVDLTGSGFNAIVLWPRIWEMFPDSRSKGVGGPLYIYVFDGEKWKLAMQDYAVVLGVRPHFDGGGRATGAQDLALADDERFRLFAFDKEKGAYVMKGESPYDREKGEFTEDPR